MSCTGFDLPAIGLSEISLGCWHTMKSHVYCTCTVHRVSGAAYNYTFKVNFDS